MPSKVPFSITNHLRFLFFFCLNFSVQASPSLSSKPTYRQRWRMPDGGLPDKTQSIVLGQTIEVSWKSLNDSVSDLWFTTLSSKTEGRKLAHLVAENVDISKDGSYTWTVDWPDTIADVSKSYTFDFLPTTDIKDHASPVDKIVPVIRSPSILVIDSSNFSPILKTPLSPSSSSSSSPKSPSKSLPLSAITLAAVEADHITTSDSNKQSLDVLIIAALVVGILCFFSFGLSAYVFVRSRRRRSKKAECGEDCSSPIAMARRMSSILWD